MPTIGAATVTFAGAVVLPDRDIEMVSFDDDEKIQIGSLSPEIGTDMERSKSGTSKATPVEGADFEDTIVLGEIPVPKENKSLLLRVIDSRVYMVVMLLASALTVFGDDLFVCATKDGGVDRYWKSVYFAAFILLTIDFVFAIAAYRLSYITTSFFLLDLTALIFVIPTWLTLFLPASSAPSFFNNTQTFQATRIARIGRTVGRFSKALRMLRLVKGCVSCFERTHSKRQLKKETTSEDLCHAGEKLRAKTLRNVIIFVLVTFFFNPCVAIITKSDRMSVEQEIMINVMNQLGSDSLTILLKGRIVTGQNSLRESEQVTILGRLGEPDIKYSVSDLARTDAILNIVEASYVLILLVVGNWAFMKNAQKIFIEPFSVMLKDLAKVESAFKGEGDYKFTVLGAEDETGMVAKAWKKMLESITRNHEDSVKLNRVATRIARHIAFMNLEEAEEEISEYSKTAQKEVILTLDHIVKTLKHYRGYLPKSLLEPLIVDPSFEPGNEKESHPAVVPASGETELVLQRRFQRRWEIRNATVMIIQLCSMEEIHTNRNKEINEIRASLESIAENILRIIEEHRGVVLSVSSHEIVVTWNSHNRVKEHACLAAACGIKSRSCALERKKVVFISIVTGTFIAGNGGALDYNAPEVISPLRPLCNRMLELNRKLGTHILITQEVHGEIGNRFLSVPCDVINYMSERITVFELCGAVGELEEINGRNVLWDSFDAFKAGDLKGCRELSLRFCKELQTKASDQMFDILNVQGNPVYHAIRCALRSLARLFVMSTIGEASPVLPKPYVRRFGWKNFECENQPETCVAVCKPHSEILAQTIVDLSGEKVGIAAPVPDAEGEELASRILRVVNEPAESEEVMAEHFASMTEGVIDFRDCNGKEWKVSSDVLGQGGFASVYYGLSDVGVLVAVKEIPLIFDDSFFKKPLDGQPELTLAEKVGAIFTEIKLLSQFSHDHIVQYMGCGIVRKVSGSEMEDIPRLYIVMEYVPCGSLRDIARRFKKLSSATVARYTRHILKGLLYLHDNDIIHRDIKPHNVLVDHDGHCKLADFGISGKMSEGSGSAPTGTCIYMAPEAFRGVTSKETDVWAVGITVAELITGEWPWAHLDLDFEDPAIEMQMMFQVGVLKQKPQVATDIDARAQDFINKCCEIEVSARPSVRTLLEHPFLAGP